MRGLVDVVGDLLLRSPVYPTPQVAGHHLQGHRLHRAHLRRHPGRADPPYAPRGPRPDRAGRPRAASPSRGGCGAAGERGRDSVGGAAAGSGGGRRGDGSGFGADVGGRSASARGCGGRGSRTPTAGVRQQEYNRTIPCHCVIQCVIRRPLSVTNLSTLPARGVVWARRATDSRAQPSRHGYRYRLRQTVS